ncbi:MAG: exodeoxyribonuclease V subunit gamma, partial [Ignavibacteria bacterium]|nr:exodeoxyribonuclease V subunit gamma [Ignavibacteria bacterium]
MYLYSKNIVKDHNPFEVIRRKIIEGKYDSFVYIVPTKRKQRYLQRELIESSKNKTLPSLNIFTIGTFAERIFNLIYPSHREISSALQSVIIKQIVSNIDLDFFHKFKKHISTGVVETIISIIGRLKEIGFNNISFKKNIEEFSGYNRIKLNDISKIFDAYQDYLNQLRMYDIGEIYSKLTELNSNQFSNAFKQTFINADYVLITGFNEFTPIELNLIEKVSNIHKHDSKLELVITLDYYDKNPEVFENLSETHNRLLSLGLDFKEFQIETTNNSFTNCLRDFLFKREDKKISPDKIKIYKFSAPNIRKEVETIAKAIKQKMVLNPGLNLDKICIAVQSIDEYANLFREIFFKYGIPTNVTDRFYLKNSLPIISIISLIKLVISNYYYKDLLKILSSKYISIENINQTNLRNVIVQEKILRGKQNYLKFIKNKLSYFESRLELEDSYSSVQYSS